MDGYELAERLRREHGAAGLRLVAITGYGQPSDRERSRKAGFDAHLVKPLDFGELMKVLERLRGASAPSPGARPASQG
jgi:CheY-like chemotaxis protein